MKRRNLKQVKDCIKCINNFYFYLVEYVYNGRLNEEVKASLEIKPYILQNAMKVEL